MSTNSNTAHTLLQDLTRDTIQCPSLSRHIFEIFTEATILKLQACKDASNSSSKFENCHFTDFNCQLHPLKIAQCCGLLQH